MLVQLASSKVLVASHGNSAVTKTRAIELGQHNYVNATLNVRDFVDLVGSPTVGLTVTAEGSNDSQNWAPLSGPEPLRTSVGVSSDEDYVLTAFLRFEITFDVSGSAGDQAQAVFCLQANLIRKC